MKAAWFYILHCAALCGQVLVLVHFLEFRQSGTGVVVMQHRVLQAALMLRSPVHVHFANATSCRIVRCRMEWPLCALF
jgi:hypothetical protein